MEQIIRNEFILHQRMIFHIFIAKWIQYSEKFAFILIFAVERVHFEINGFQKQKHHSKVLSGYKQTHFRAILSHE